jgi:hypothetical protein
MSSTLAGNLSYGMLIASPASGVAAVRTWIAAQNIQFLIESDHVSVE